MNGLHLNDWLALILDNAVLVESDGRSNFGPFVALNFNLKRIEFFTFAAITIRIHQANALPGIGIVKKLEFTGAPVFFRCFRNVVARIVLINQVGIIIF